MMLLIRGIIISHLVCLCYSAESTRSFSFKTGNQLAVLRFEGWAISEPLTEHLTEELRKSIREWNIFQVQDRGLTNEISIFYPRTKDYWACWSEECAIDLGRRLNVNYVIAGNIQKKDKNEFAINGRLFSVDMETQQQGLQRILQQFITSKKEAKAINNRNLILFKKRMKRFELSTHSLARRCSTTELHPRIGAWGKPLTTNAACNTEGPLVKREV